MKNDKELLDLNLKENVIKELPDNLTVLDVDGTILYVNNSWRVFARDNGLDPEHCSEGTNYLDVCDNATGYNSDEAPVAAQGIKDVIYGYKDAFEMEYPCHAPDKKRWYLMKVIPLERDEKPCPVTLYHLNITQRKLSEIEAENLNETKDMFTDILRHDLKNPIGIARGFAEALYKKESDYQKQGLIDKIINNINRSLDLIEEAGELAKVESMDSIEFEKIELAEILENVIEKQRARLDNKNMDIVFLRNGHYFAYANSIIEQAFANLISNSIKYSPINSDITIDVLDDDEFWKVRVIDTGYGISDEDKEQLFDRFSRGNNKKTKGKGLGLSIVKNIVQMHGGEVGVEDNPEGGSIFWITVCKFE